MNFRLYSFGSLVFVFVFALYFFTRSPGLDELDSVQFAMGVGQFDLWRNQPHPPGYPLYIFFGWAAQMFCKWDPVFSLHVASCLGGALFVTTWFLICRTQFNETFGWWIASTLAVTPVLWLSATKPMTDALAAGLLGAQLLCSLRYRRSANDRYLILAALAGAAAAGVRPQFFAVVLVVLLVALFQVRARRRDWWIAITLLVAGCLVWLLPMSYLQWKLHPEIPWWQVYPRLIWQQWNWRLEEPSVYIGAHNAWKLSYLTNRIYSHFAGWFILGLGLWRSTLTLVAGSLLVALGVATYLFRLREEDREFWKQNWAWATLHILIIFCSLPWEPRYYLPIFPLLLVPITFGLLRLPGFWKVTAGGLPVLLLCISIPLAIDHHSREAPATRFARYLQDRYAPQERPNVLLVLNHCFRHVQWYAPGFAIVTGISSLADADQQTLNQTETIYTDDPDLKLTPDWHLVPLARFTCSDVINLKLGDISLSKVEPSDSDLGEQIIIRPGRK